MELLQNNTDTDVNVHNNSSSFLKPGFNGGMAGSTDGLNLEDILETHNLLDADNNFEEQEQHLERISVPLYNTKQQQESSGSVGGKNRLI